MELVKGKKVLITGGTAGIGKGMALTFAKNGSDVIIFGTNEERGSVIVNEMRELAQSEDQKFGFLKVDVSNYEESLAKAQEAMDLLGGVDVLINNAGITRDKLLMKMDEEDWDQVLDVNLKSVFNFCKAVVRPMMKARSGKIINISSVIGLTGNPGQVNYAASKSGMIGFTQSLAKEVSSRGVCVNCIAPGFIQTPMTDALNETQKAAIMQKIPMQKLGQTEDIANVCLFLASKLSDYVTGEVIAVDGGMTA
ncbi:MAG: 3-oxoacyl-[acyl-carrier-protein] reductase [Rhabdochlamydiaceae bacterium]|nr:3-oxoacyl-[acyl-carrier-protein] reductase [Candidatus Amphrikana amoebophyrae]